MRELPKVSCFPGGWPTIGNYHPSGEPAQQVTPSQEGPPRRGNGHISPGTAFGYAVFHRKCLHRMYAFDILSRVAAVSISE
jgi:hypothetical protein